MSFRAEADWERATRDDGDVLVPFVSVPPDTWWEVFTQTAYIWESETRGQKWRGLGVETDGSIRFEEVEPDADQASLRSYLDELISVVNDEYARQQ